MGVLAECVGDCVDHELVHKGKTYKIKTVTQDVKAQFEKKLFAKARDAALTLKPCMSVEEYGRHLARMNDEYLAGEYALESKRGLALAQVQSGALLLLSLLLGVDEMEAVKLMGERKSDLLALLDVVLKESFPGSSSEEEGQADADIKSDE